MARLGRKIDSVVPLLLILLVGLVQPVQLVHALAWSSPILIDASPGLSGLPSSLQASNGTLWIAWESSRNSESIGRFDVIYKTYTNGV